MKNTVVLFGEEWEINKINHKELGDGFEIIFAQMYSPPTLSFDNMLEISEYFGTKEIDFNNSISTSGCETCDYGSFYGYEIEVYKATKNIPVFS